MASEEQDTRREGAPQTQAGPELPGDDRSLVEQSAMGAAIQVTRRAERRRLDPQLEPADREDPAKVDAVLLEIFKRISSLAARAVEYANQDPLIAPGGELLVSVAQGLVRMQTPFPSRADREGDKRVKRAEMERRTAISGRHRRALRTLVLAEQKRDRAFLVNAALESVAWARPSMKGIAHLTEAEKKQRQDDEDSQKQEALTMFRRMLGALIPELEGVSNEDIATAFESYRRPRRTGVKSRTMALNGLLEALGEKPRNADSTDRAVRRAKKSRKSFWKPQ